MAEVIKTTTVRYMIKLTDTEFNLLLRLISDGDMPDFTKDEQELRDEIEMTFEMAVKR